MRGCVAPVSVWLLMLVFGAMPTARGASAVAAPANIRAAMVLKAISYTRGAASGPIRVALLSGDNDAARSDAVAMATLWKQLGAGGTAVLDVRMFNSSAGARTKAGLASFAPASLYIPHGADAVVELGLIGSLATIVVCGDPVQVHTGCGLAVEIIGRRPRLVLFPSAARARGVTWDAKLLQLARVVE